VDFYQRFELLELSEDVGVRVFQARQADSGRPVTVSFFVGQAAQTHRDLLDRLHLIQVLQLPGLIEFATLDNTPYSVTQPVANFQELQAWAAAVLQPKSAPKGPENYTRVGVWRVPPAPTQQAPAGLEGEPQAAPVPQAEPKEPGEFTRMFQTQTPPAPMGEPPPVPPKVPEQPRPAVAPHQPGEFTRMFQTPTPPAPMGEPEPPPRAAAPIEPGPAVAPHQPGEFTRMFNTPPSNAPPPSSAAPPAGPRQLGAEPVGVGGEFTRFFGSAMPSSELGQSLGSAQLPPPTPPPATHAPPGEFTRIFGKQEMPPWPPVSPAVPPPPTSAPGGSPGTATQSFATPAPPPPPVAPAAPSVPGEYTRMFGTPSFSPPEPQPLPPTPAPVSAPPPQQRVNYLPLLIVLAVLFVAAVAVIIVLLVKK
jgi:hypothetical protein